jgi:hypothetical protein
MVTKDVESHISKTIIICYNYEEFVKRSSSRILIIFQDLFYSYISIFLDFTKLSFISIILFKPYARIKGKRMEMFGVGKEEIYYL